MANKPCPKGSGFPRLRPMLILGVETSCDETACGLVDENFRVLGQITHTQIPQHALYGGVVPEIAARAHLEKLPPVLSETLKQAGVALNAVDAIAFTRGPGLLGPLLVGASFARGLARARGIPAYGMHHLESHLGAALLAQPDLRGPFLCLVVSGGHTEILAVSEDWVFTRLGRTRDDAAGEAFDKTGKLMGLQYPAGAELALRADSGNAKAVAFPRALMEKDSLEFSFSGLKSSVARHLRDFPDSIEGQGLPDLCASIQAAIVDVLVRKVGAALRLTGRTTLAVVGGVAANSSLRQALIQAYPSCRCVFPEPRYCGDNGVMVAAAAQWRWHLGRFPTGMAAKPNLAWNEDD